MAVWDGRFEIMADQPIEIRPLAGLAARLPKDQRQALAAFPPKARAALPAALDGERVTCLALDAERCRPLGHARLQAACGLVEREPA
jgi:tRNA(Ile)-lysidine synthase